MKVQLYILLIGFLFFQGCISDSKDVPSSFVQPEEMKKILYECYVADALNTERINRDQNLQLQKENIAYYKKIMDNYGVDQKKFFASIEYYNAHPKLFSELADSLDVYAKRMGDIKINLPENTNNGHHLRHLRK